MVSLGRRMACALELLANWVDACLELTGVPPKKESHTEEGRDKRVGNRE